MKKNNESNKAMDVPEVMVIECIGEVTKEGTISIDPSLLSDYEVGSKVKITLILPEDEDEAKDSESLDSAT